MTRKALIIGGSGQIGRAVARRLLDDGWSVRCAQRSPEDLPHDILDRGAEAVVLDRAHDGALAEALAGGVDALIDTVAYDETHARQLLGVQADVGAFVVISSGSVYRDAEGRTLDEAGETGFPRFPTPIAEDQPTIAPGPATYSTRKAALEQTLLQSATRPVTILRPGAIHGEGSPQPREWWLVKRILDGRRKLPLAWAGQSRFHTTATVNIAAACAAALETSGAGPLNVGDPQALTVQEITQVIAAVFDHDWQVIPIGGAPVGTVGASPWSIPRPIVLDMSKAATVGYEPAVSYADAAPAACRWLQTVMRGADWRDVAPGLAAYPMDLFDYAAEDAFFEQRGP